MVGFSQETTMNVKYREHLIFLPNGGVLVGYMAEMLPGAIIGSIQVGRAVYPSPRGLDPCEDTHDEGV
jgi:hypothetical protein